VSSIESVLSLHPAVAEVAVAGLPDEPLGPAHHRLRQARRNADVAVDPAALDAWCRASSLADYKRPRDYVFIAEIPKSPVGKILRRLLVAGEYGRE
jgi:2-furoate---CoA ligase